MRNWLGQDIVVGSTVYRGARDGNSSSFKVGRVKELKPDTKKARVEWLFTDGHPYKYKGNEPHNGKVLHAFEGNAFGSCDINSLVLVDVDLEDMLDFVAMRGNDVVYIAT